MCLRFLRVLAGSLVLAPLLSSPLGARALRVCADPNNMPYSNEQGQGFENKIASLTAARLGETLEYTWWAERKSFLKHSLNEGRCDVVLGIPASLENVDVTRPYYRSSYVFVSRRDRNLRLTNVSDPRLANLRIGIHVVGDNYAPPAFALARRGITQNVVGFSLFGAYGERDPAGKIIQAVDEGAVDVAIVWGPFAGYFARTAKSALEIAPIEPPIFLGVPFTYEISMGVRKGDSVLKSELDRVLKSEASSIRQILHEYGIPQIH